MSMTSEMQSPVALILCGGGSRGARYSAALIHVGYQQSLAYFNQNPLPYPVRAPTIGERIPDRTPAMH